VRDLLHPDTPSKSISIRERADGAILVSGMKEEVCPTVEALERALERGALCRTTGATRMNSQSSRSHAIFTVIVEQRLLSPQPGECAYMAAKFHLVDLAGSERNKKTDAAGARFKEAVNINSGLLVLGNVINALCDRGSGGLKARGHVPYRDSKLTRLLQDSLGGNARTVMIACVSTADSNIEETVNTLKYAERARAIRNRPTVNVDPAAASLAAYREDDGDASVQAMAAAAQAEARAAEAVAVSAAATLQVSKLRAELEAAKRATCAAEEGARAARAERELAQLELAAESRPGGTPHPSGEGLKHTLRSLSDVEARLLAKETALQQVEALLAEAQADLARDELIFRDKLQEAKTLKRALKEATQALEESRVAGEALQRQCAAAAAAAAAAQAAPAVPPGACAVCGRTGGGGGGAAPPDAAPATAGKDEEQLPGSSAHGRRGSLDVPCRASVVFNPAAPQPAAPGDDPPAREVEALEQALAQKEAERAALLAAKSRAEAAQLMAEADAEREAADFARSKAGMERQLREMEFAISRKEELCADLARNEEAARALSQRYEARMKDLEAAVAAREAEAEALRRQLESFDAASKTGHQEDSRAQAVAESALAAANAQLAALRDAQRAGAADLKLQRAGEAKAAALAAELQRMRSAQEQLRKKLSSTADAHALEAAAVAKDMATLRREAEASCKRVRDLEAENARQRAVLQKRAEEVLSAHRKLRGAPSTTTPSMAAPPGAPAEPSWWPGLGGAPEKVAGMAAHAAAGLRASASPLPQQRPSAASPSPSPLPALPGARARAASGVSSSVTLVPRKGSPSDPGAPPAGWLTLELAALLRCREAQEDAAATALKRAGVARERQAVAQDKAALELRRARAAATLEASLAASALSISEAEAHVSALLAGAQPDAPALCAARLAHGEAYRERAALEARRRGGVATLLGAAEGAAAAELDDRLDALETEEDYLVAASAEAAREAEAAASGAASFKARAAGLGAADARAALADVADAAVGAAAAARRDAQRAAAAEAALAERARELAEATAQLARRELDYDRRVVALQKEHAKKVQVLLQQAAAVGQLAERPDAASPRPQLWVHASLASDAAAFKEEQLRSLERDARYHKQVNKELKRRVAEVTTEKSDVEAERDALALRREEAEALAATLLEEVAGLRDRLRVTSARSASDPLQPPPPWLAAPAPQAAGAGGASPVRVERPLSRGGGRAAPAPGAPEVSRSVDAGVRLSGGLPPRPPSSHGRATE